MTTVFVKWNGTSHRRVLTNFDLPTVEGLEDRWEVVWRSSEGHIAEVDARLSEVITTWPEFQLASPNEVATAIEGKTADYRRRAEQANQELRLAQQRADKADQELKDAEAAEVEAQKVAADQEAAQAEADRVALEAASASSLAANVPEEASGEGESPDANDDAPDET